MLCIYQCVTIAMLGITTMHVYFTQSENEEILSSHLDTELGRYTLLLCIGKLVHGFWGLVGQYIIAFDSLTKEIQKSMA